MAISTVAAFVFYTFSPIFVNQSEATVTKLRKKNLNPFFYLYLRLFILLLAYFFRFLFLHFLFYVVYMLLAAKRVFWCYIVLFVAQIFECIFASELNSSRILCFCYGIVYVITFFVNFCLRWQFLGLRCQFKRWQFLSRFQIILLRKFIGKFSYSDSQIVAEQNKYDLGAKNHICLLILIPIPIFVLNIAY